MSEAPSHVAREFRLAAENRRCGWYVFLGTLITIGVVASLRHQGLVPAQGGWESFAVGSMAAVVPALALLIFVYQWRIRVDETGIARRQFWDWDLWAWDDFSAGKFKRSGMSFVSTSRPWWQKRLTFEFLTEQDQEFLVDACKFFFEPAKDEPEGAPDGAITVRFALRSTIAIREDGISGKAGRRTFEHSWANVKQVRLIYYDHWSSELRRIEFELPDRTLLVAGISSFTNELQERQRNQDPKVVPPAVERTLRTLVPSEKLVRHGLRGPPLTLGECEHRIRKLQRELARHSWAYRTVPAGTLIFALFIHGPNLVAALARGPAGFPNVGWFVLATSIVVAITVSYPLMIWALLRFLRNLHVKMLDELQAWKAQHLTENSGQDRPTSCGSKFATS